MSKILIPVLIIIFGLLMLLRNVFGWHVSFFKVLVGIAIVAVGISFLTGGFNWFRNGFGGRGDGQYQGSPAGANEDVVFSQRHFSATGSAKFTFVFSSGTVDLTNMPSGEHTVTVDSLFSGVTVYVRPDQQIRIRGSAVFGSMQTPGGDGVFFGSIGRGNGEAEFMGNAVFGGIEVVERL